MAKDDDKQKWAIINSMLTTRKIEKMGDLKTLYPTFVSKALKMNHSRYMERLFKPDQFTIRHVRQLATLIGINPQVIIDIILKQPASPKKTAKKK
jgi:hypothetical protein